MSIKFYFNNLPFQEALQVFTAAKGSVRLIEEGLFSQREVPRSSPEYAVIVQKIALHKIKTELQPLLREAGIREDLRILEMSNPCICAAAGTNFFRGGEATILVAPGFYRVDPDACTMMVKHEIAHIKHNDAFTIPCATAAGRTTALIFAGFMGLSTLPAQATIFAATLGTRVVFTKWRESEADNFAIEHATIKELVGGVRFFMALKTIAKNNRTSFGKRLMYSPEGESRADIFHPSLSSRMQKVEKALLQRGVHVDYSQQAGKIADLTHFLEDFMIENKLI